MRGKEQARDGVEMTTILVREISPDGSEVKNIVGDCASINGYFSKIFSGSWGYDPEPYTRKYLREILIHRSPNDLVWSPRIPKGGSLEIEAA